LKLEFPSASGPGQPDQARTEQTSQPAFLLITRRDFFKAVSQELARCVSTGSRLYQPRHEVGMQKCGGTLRGAAGRTITRPHLTKVGIQV